MLTNVALVYEFSVSTISNSQDAMQVYSFRFIKRKAIPFDAA
jgi:hypothetical protein